MRHMRIQKIPTLTLVFWLLKPHKQINPFSLSVSCNWIAVVILYWPVALPIRVCLPVHYHIPTVFPPEFPLTLCFQWFAVAASRKGSVMFSWLMSLFNAHVSVCILGFIKRSNRHWHHWFDYIIGNGFMPDVFLSYCSVRCFSSVSMEYLNETCEIMQTFVGFGVHQKGLENSRMERFNGCPVIRFYQCSNFFLNRLHITNPVQVIYSYNNLTESKELMVHRSKIQVILSMTYS